MSISGFENKRREDEELKELQAILSPAEFRVLMAFRELRPHSVLELTIQGDGKGVIIRITHGEVAPLDVIHGQDRMK